MAQPRVRIYLLRFSQLSLLSSASFFPSKVDTVSSQVTPKSRGGTNWLTTTPNSLLASRKESARRKLDHRFGVQSGLLCVKWVTALSTSKQGSAQTSGPFIKALAPKEVQEASFGRWQASKRSCVLGASSGVVYGGGVVVAASLVFLLTTPTTCCLRVCISTPSCVRIVFSWTQLGGLIGRLCYTHTHTHGRCPCSDLFFSSSFFLQGVDLSRLGLVPGACVVKHPVFYRTAVHPPLSTVSVLTWYHWDITRLPFPECVNWHEVACCKCVCVPGQKDWISPGPTRGGCCFL